MLIGVAVRAPRVDFEVQAALATLFSVMGAPVGVAETTLIAITTRTSRIQVDFHLPVAAQEVAGVAASSVIFLIDAVVKGMISDGPVTMERQIAVRTKRIHLDLVSYARLAAFGIFSGGMTVEVGTSFSQFSAIWLGIDA